MTQRILYSVNNAAKKLNFHRSSQISAIISETRCFATVSTVTNNATNRKENFKNTESDKFKEVYHKILADIKKADLDAGLSEANQWFSKALEYNLPHGKLNRGMALVETYLQLNDNQTDTSSMERVRILGWSLEFLQTFFLLYDDIMDNSITRRGKPCWYRNSDVGMMAINDTLMIEYTCYDLVKKHFGNEKYYSDLINLYIDIVRKTIYGQCLDMLSFQRGVTNNPDLAKYTMERYSSIVKHKTAYYSFCLPVQLAMHISGVNDRKAHSIAEQILLKIGEYFQIQDDVLDCFGDPKVTGKVGTDIEDGKCCWTVVTALQKANRKQYEVIERNYGINDSVAVENVKRVYNELNIENEFDLFADKCYDEICKDIESINKSIRLPANIFYSILNKIHKRQK